MVGLFTSARQTWTKACSRAKSPAAYVLRLAETKARACAATSRRNEVFLGADTAVVDGDAILGKPKDRPEAAQMLQRLRGRIHQVYTGIAIFRPSDGNLVTRSMRH